MLILSGAFHIVLGLVSLVVSLYQPPKRFEPVAIVNLVGGGDFPKTQPKAAASKEAPSLAPATKGRSSKPARKDDFPLSKKPEKKEKEPKASAQKKTPETDSNALASVSERLRKMREEQAGADSVRKAIEERRSEAAAREAVRGVRERVAHRIENPSESDVRGAGSGGGRGGSQGTVRVSPEMLEFFRRLEERVRESWVPVIHDASGMIVEVRITIEKDGRVSDTRIEKGSGNVYFDESVRRAIQKASPLPVPPERLRGGEDYYEIGFRFHGAGGRG